MAVIVYSTSCKGVKFSDQFIRRYAELSGGTAPQQAFAAHRFRVGDDVTARVLEELGAAACGSGIGVATVDDWALAATRVHEYDGFETVEIDHNLLCVLRCREVLQARGHLTAAEFEAIYAQCRAAAVRYLEGSGSAGSAAPARRVSYGVPVENRFELLSGLPTPP